MVYFAVEIFRIVGFGNLPENIFADYNIKTLKNTSPGNETEMVQDRDALRARVVAYV